MQKPPETFFNPEDFGPELREIFAQPPLDSRKTVLVAAPVKNPDDHDGRFIPAESERNLIALTDGKSVWDWEVRGHHGTAGTLLPDV